MHRTSAWFAAASALAVSSCETLRFGRGPAPPPVTGVVLIDEPIIVDGEVFDMGGREFRGHDVDSQSEDGLPLFILRDDAVLRNGTITRSAEGVWFRGTGSRVENVAFPDVFEDAVSTRSMRCEAARGERRNRVVGCYFRYFADKAVQQNQGELEVSDCTFVHGVTPIRQAGQSPRALVTHVWGNRYHNTHSMAKADGTNPASLVTAHGNTGHHVREPAWEVSGKTRMLHLDAPPLPP